MSSAPAVNVLLVHGGFVDGSGWQGVYEILKRDGYRVTVVQNPTLSLHGDVEVTHRALDALEGPAVLVGHSYGGAVIAEAEAHVAAITKAGLAALSPRLALVAAGAAAMVAAEDECRTAFDTALAVPDAGRWPFHRARIQLAYGERLRRAKITTEARKHLTAALDTFERLDARPWITRARNELRASGLRVGAAAGQDALDSLTPQQREIARLAAAGLTNKQIGEQLFLSPRTVGTHLYQLFPKLGITSRAALRDALGDALDAD